MTLIFFYISGDIDILLYFYGPIAFLCACNIAFNVHTYCTYRNIAKKFAVLRNLTSEQPSQSSSTAAMTTFEHKRHRRDNDSEYDYDSFYLNNVLDKWIIAPPLMFGQLYGEDSKFIYSRKTVLLNQTFMIVYVLKINHFRALSIRSDFYHVFFFFLETRLSLY